jgi:hypothetical protein
MYWQEVAPTSFLRNSFTNTNEAIAIANESADVGPVEIYWITCSYPVIKWNRDMFFSSSPLITAAFSGFNRKFRAFLSLWYFLIAVSLANALRRIAV